MPFVKRAVEPVDLSNKPLPNDGLSEIETVTVRVCNNTLCGLVMQLANLAHQANSIFDEILGEGNKIAERTANLGVRVVKLEENVSKLDARAVQVPVSTLDGIKIFSEHFQTPQICPKELFSPSTRPQCVNSVYERACMSLKSIRDRLKEYHEDEVTLYSVKASSLFDQEGKAQFDYQIYFPHDLDQLPSPHEQKPERISQPRRIKRTMSERDAFLDQRRTHLPTPEQLMRLSAPPSTYISVDTSGENFRRLSQVRRSLTLQSLELAQRRRRHHGHMEWRSTIAGIPNAIQMEFDRSSQGSTISTSALTEELRTQSLDRRMLKSKKRSYFSRRGISILSSLRTKKNSKLVLPPTCEEILESGSLKQLEQIPVTNWTGSLPRNVKLNGELRTRNGSAQKGRIMNRWSADYSTSEESSSSNSIDRTMPNGSIHHNGIASLGRPRNRGLRLQQASVPDGIISSKPHTLSITHLDNPQDGHKPSIVQLRSRKPFQTKEERRSSSGNWSGTDSNRTSINSDSEIVQILSTNQDGSPSDSAVSLSNEADQTTPTGPNPYFLSTDFGQYRNVAPRPNELSFEVGRSGSESSGTPTPTNEEVEFNAAADKWLKIVTPTAINIPRSEAGNIAPASKTPNPALYQPTFSDSSSESSEHPSLSALSDQSSIDLDLCLADAVEEYNDTDSVCTIDQDGYWTSMHFDCGLPHLKPSLSRLEKGISEGQPQETEGMDLDIAPPPPKRVDSMTAEGQDGITDASSSASLTPTNLSSDDNATTSADCASDVSESSVTLPEPMQKQTKMYNLVYNETRKPQVTTFDSQNKKPLGQKDNIFFGMFPSANSMVLPQKSRDSVSPDGPPKSPLGLYPDNYNIMVRKKTMGPKGDAVLRHDVVRVGHMTDSHDVVRVASNGKDLSGNGATPPQQAGDVKVNAMSHEERAEILQMLRNSRNTGNGGPKSPVPVTQTTFMLQVDKGQVSFRESYKENVQEGKLDPDKAIIEAAKQLEENRREKDYSIIKRPSLLSIEESSSEEDDDPNTSKTPDEIYPYLDFVYDPEQKPKFSILKKTTPKKDDTQLLKEKIEASKKQNEIDPFEEVLSPPPKPPPVVETPPRRRISFSRYVHVDNKPVKMCNSSGRPVTRRDGFLALECELEAPTATQGPSTAELLYRGAMKSDSPDKAAPIAMMDDDEDDDNEELQTVQEQKQFKVVTVTAIKDVANAPKSVEIVNIPSCLNGVPASDKPAIQAESKDSPQLRGAPARTEDRSKAGDTSGPEPAKSEELDALLAELSKFSTENDQLWDEKGGVQETSIDKVKPNSESKNSDEELEALMQSLQLNNNESSSSQC